MSGERSDVQPVKVRISERATELEAREIMFAARPICTGCGEKVEVIEDAIAVLKVAAGTWQLLHRAKCQMNALFSLGQAGKPLGISPAAYLRRFA